MKINNSGLTSIKVHEDIATDGELKKVKTALRTNLQMNTYTAAAGSDVYTAGICDYDPSTVAKVAGSTKGCK